MLNNKIKANYFQCTKQFKFALKVLLFLFVCFLSLGIFSLKAKDMQNNCPETTLNEYVVLLHGIFKNSRQMRRMEKYLTKECYTVLNISYPSTKKSLSEIADQVWQEIETKTNKDTKINFVGYSMGGLVTRTILNKYRPKNLGRVVLVATPNHGSEVADFFDGLCLYDKVTGPAGHELITNQKNFKDNLGSPYYEVGVLAGDFSIDLLSSLLIKGEDDGKVSLESAKIENMTAYKTLSASHFSIARKKITILETINFLKYGKFLDTN